MSKHMLPTPPFRYAASWICRRWKLLRGAVDVLLTAARRRITMDLHQVTAIDRAGVLFFTALQHGLSTHRGDLCLVNATTPVRAALRHGQVRYAETT